MGEIKLVLQQRQATSLEVGLLIASGWYFRLRPGGYTEYRRWLPVVAAARLSENIPELEQWLVAQAAGLD